MPGPPVSEKLPTLLSTMVMFETALLPAAQELPIPAPLWSPHARTKLPLMEMSLTLTAPFSQGPAPMPALYEEASASTSLPTMVMFETVVPPSLESPP